MRVPGCRVNRIVRGAKQAHGFSLAETLVALALTLVIVAAVLSVLNPAQGSVQTEPERIDIQQRLRVAVSTLHSNLLMAGAGTYIGGNAGPLTYFFAPVRPFRHGLRRNDPPGTFRSDTITLLFVPSTASQTTIAQPMAAQTADAVLSAGSGCPVSDPACGFAEGKDALIYDQSGYNDLFTVTGVQGPVLHLQHDYPDDVRTYAAGSRIVEVLSRTYYVKTDNVSRTYQLVSYDDGNGDDVPVVDHVVGLTFEYYGDPQPPLVRRLLTQPTGPWTTYGPRPPPANAQWTGYPPGESCLFAIDSNETPVPRLQSLGAPSALVRLDAGQLTDGPWCPDADSPNRLDADLLRIRKIGVKLRIEAASDAARGPAGPLFLHAGLAKLGSRLVPDREISFEVTPRNLNLTR